MFSPLFKAALKENWRRRKGLVPEGRMDTGEWLRTIFATVNEILAKDWADVFRKGGISCQQRALSSNCA